LLHPADVYGFSRTAGTGLISEGVEDPPRGDREGDVVLRPSHPRAPTASRASFGPRWRPVGDRLTSERNEVEVIEADGALRDRFDLEAD